MEVTGQFHALLAIPLEKESLVPIGEEAGWSLELVWMLWSMKKSLAPVRYRTLAVQSVAHRYTN
jgi:hypothetical protein